MHLKGALSKTQYAKMFSKDNWALERANEVLKLVQSFTKCKLFCKTDFFDVTKGTDVYTRTPQITSCAAFVLISSYALGGEEAFYRKAVKRGLNILFSAGI